MILPMVFFIVFKYIYHTLFRGLLSAAYYSYVFMNAPSFGKYGVPGQAFGILPYWSKLSEIPDEV
jgi:hypothetical protein